MTAAVYAGSFDPITLGHYSIIREAANLFTRVIVCVADNPDKAYTFNKTKRIELVQDSIASLDNVEVGETSDLVIDFAKKNKAAILIRGLRGAADLEFEMELAHVNKIIEPTISTLFIPADPKLSEVSSTAVKKWRLKAKTFLGIVCPTLSRL